MDIDVIDSMDDIYEKLVKLLGCLLEPLPMNQLGMPDYCRYILSVLAEVKKEIEELEDTHRRMMRSYDMSIDEEF